MSAFQGANGKRKEERQCLAHDWMKRVTEWRKEGPNNFIKSCSCIWQMKTKMFLNLIIRMSKVTFEEQFQEVSGSHEGSKVGTPSRNLVVMGWGELSLEGKSVLGIIFCCCLLGHYLKDSWPLSQHLYWFSSYLIGHSLVFMKKLRLEDTIGGLERHCEFSQIWFSRLPSGPWTTPSQNGIRDTEKKADGGVDGTAFCILILPLSFSPEHLLWKIILNITYSETAI